MEAHEFEPLLPSIGENVDRYLPQAASAALIFRSFGVTRESLSVFVAGTARSLRTEVRVDAATAAWLDRIIEQSLAVTAGVSPVPEPVKTAEEGARRVFDPVGAVSLAHDVGNASAVINAFLDELAQSLPAGDDGTAAREVLAEIRDQSDTIRQSTDEFRIDVGGGKATAREPFDLARLVSPRKVRAVMGSHIDVSYEIKESFRVVGSRAQLWRVVNNLLKNAREAMSNSLVRQLRIELTGVRLEEEGEVPAGRYVRLTVRDTGQGIPPEKLKNLFEPFRSTKEAATDAPVRGVGLWGIREMVKNHGGFVSAESVLGAGTAFHIHLPTISRADQIKYYQAGHHADVPILVVDDSIFIIMILEKFLGLLGYRNVIHTQSAESALEMMREQKLGLIITDHNMEGMDGITMTHKIREDNDEIPIILSSATSDLPFPETGRNRKIKKPANHLELARTVKELLTLVDAERGSSPR